MTASGEIYRIDVTYGGKSVKSLPSNSAITKATAEFATLGILLSVNYMHKHWSNQDTTLAAIKDVAKHKMLEQKNRGLSKEDVLATPLVYSLDCRPVNLTVDTKSAVKRELPAAKLMYIPAKGLAQTR